MTYRESIDWLFSTQWFGIKLGLDGPRQLLKEFLAYPPHTTRVLHVAGTNGKGSTCAIADSVARAAGVRTGLFTSPHLLDFRERIRVAGEEIPEDACAEWLTDLRKVCEGLETHPTFFEITLALGMRWFRERNCELIILETGMGGRLDATTAVPADVCGITPIGMDHMQWLGDTLGEIAAEKAGIFLEGVPAFSAPQKPEAREVLLKEANERRCPLRFVREPLGGYPIGLAGPHQAWNAALALDCLHALDLPLSYEVVRHGLSGVRWPGRFERIEHEGRKVVLDGAHNADGANALAETWRECFGGASATLVFSAVASKDVAGIAAPLRDLAAEVHLCPVDSPRALAVEDLQKFFPEGVAHGSFAEAIGAALMAERPILIAGSLFLIGEAKEWLEGGGRMISDQ
jgi:dihydrofolate synthase/folylpolyglutamate synthase